jgi:hypothetical protein
MDITPISSLQNLHTTGNAEPWTAGKRPNTPFELPKSMPNLDPSPKPKAIRTVKQVLQQKDAKISVNDILDDEFF